MGTPRAEQIIEERYRLVRPLGQGGQGTTWKAEDLSNGQRVALKALSLRAMANWKSLELFQRESRVLEALDHPGVPDFVDSLHDSDMEAGGFFLVQELIEGPTLSERVNQGWHPGEQSVQALATALLETLVYLHERNPALIHRDIKPSNIIMRTEDARPVLVDFGAVQDSVRGEHSIASTVVGTYGYMAPEQFRGQATAQSDLYALGATLMFTLTQQAPEALPQERLKINVSAVTNLSPNFTRWLETLLEPFPEDRFQSAAEALNALQNLDSDPPDTPPALGPAPQNLKDNSSAHVLDLTLQAVPIRNLSTTQVFIRSLGVIGIFCIFITLITALLANPSVLPLVLFITFLIFFGFAKAMHHWFKTQRLVMDHAQDSFRIERSILGKTWRTEHGKISQLKLIRIAVPERFDKRAHEPSPYIRMVTQETSISMGSQLSRQEQSWAATRISNYLD